MHPNSPALLVLECLSRGPALEWHYRGSEVEGPALRSEVKKGRFSDDIEDGGKPNGHFNSPMGAKSLFTSSFN